MMEESCSGIARCERALRSAMAEGTSILTSDRRDDQVTGRSEFAGPEDEQIDKKPNSERKAPGWPQRRNLDPRRGVEDKLEPARSQIVEHDRDWYIRNADPIQRRVASRLERVDDDRSGDGDLLPVDQPGIGLSSGDTGQALERSRR